MDRNKKIKQIGYMPTTIEEAKLQFVTDFFEMTRTSIIRNLIHGHITLEDLYQHAIKLKEMKGDDNAMNIVTDYRVNGHFLI